MVKQIRCHELATLFLFLSTTHFPQNASGQEGSTTSVYPFETGNLSTVTFSLNTSEAGNPDVEITSSGSHNAPSLRDVTESMTTLEVAGNLSTGSPRNVSMLWSWSPVSWSWNMVLQLILAIMGILGNLLVMLVLFKRRSLSQSTDTLIGALAVADFLTSVLIIPIPTASVVPPTWVGELYCRILYTGFFMWLSVSASIFTLTTISIERFFAVLFPFAFNRLLMKRHVVLAILTIWLVALAADFFIALTISVDPVTQSCVYGFPSKLAQDATGVTSFLLHFAIPAIVMLSTQAATARILYQQSLQFGSGGDKNSRSTSSYRLLRAKNRVLKLLLVVILIFILCWGPNSIAYFLFNIGVIPYTYLYGNLNRVLTLLAFCNSCANPFIYTIQYPQFRTAILELFTCSRSPLGALFESHAESSATQAKYEKKSVTHLTDMGSHA